LSKGGGKQKIHIKKTVPEKKCQKDEEKKKSDSFSTSKNLPRKGATI